MFVTKFIRLVCVITSIGFLFTNNLYSGSISTSNLRVPMKSQVVLIGELDDESGRVKKWNEIWRFELKNPKVKGPSILACQLVKEKKIKDRQKILSLGAGYGKDEIYFVENIDCEVIATDFSQVVVDYIGNIARQRNLEFKGKLKAKSQDITKQFDFRDNSFDVVYAHQSLIYFLDDEKMIFIIREIHRVLKPGGKVFISVRSINDWKYVENPKAKNNVATGEDGITRRFFDRQSLKELFERLNFGDITIEGNVIDRYKNESPATVLYLFASKRANFLHHKELRDQI